MRIHKKVAYRYLKANEVVPAFNMDRLKKIVSSFLSKQNKNLKKIFTLSDRMIKRCFRIEEKFTTTLPSLTTDIESFIIELKKIIKKFSLVEKYVNNKIAFFGPAYFGIAIPSFGAAALLYFKDTIRDWVTFLRKPISDDLDKEIHRMKQHFIQSALSLNQLHEDIGDFLVQLPSVELDLTPTYLGKHPEVRYLLNIVAKLEDLREYVNPKSSKLVKAAWKVDKTLSFGPL